MRHTYGKQLPGMNLFDLAGKLIVIEGTDGAGRTTQINLLKPWLEELGHAVLDTGMTRSPLAGEGIRRAKEGNNLGRVTQSLFYATDFIDRLENEIMPALRAGFIVLTDRYIYSLMARAIVRGMDAAWIRSIYSVALVPDAIFYLRVDVEQLIPRVVFSRGFDYWESGMDVFPGHDMYEAFATIRPRCSRNSTGSAWSSNSRQWTPPPMSTSSSRSFRPRVQRILNRTSRTEVSLDSAEARREYLHKVFELAAAATMRGEPRSVAPPRESAARGMDWGFHPVTANLSSGNGRKTADHK